MRAVNAIRGIIPRFGKGAKPTAEALEMALYDSFKEKTAALNKISYHKNHYLHGVSSLIKSEGIRLAPVAGDSKAVSGPPHVLLYI